MSDKIRVAILFGGRSAEHEVSLQSARNVIDALDRDRYQPVLIGIDKKGRWSLCDEVGFLRSAEDPERIHLHAAASEVSLVPWGNEGRLISVAAGKVNSVVDGHPRDQGLPRIDVVFPVLHGPMGEDGTIQGLLRLADLPYVGAGVLGSAVGMDKDVMKRLLRVAGIPVGRFRAIRRNEYRTSSFDELAEELGTPLFIKPANMGSSVGIHKITEQCEFAEAIIDAFRFDTKVIVEQNIVGREVECAVLGNDEPRASVPGEVRPTHGFYSYEAKYVDPEGASLKIPARLAPDVTRRVQELAIETFKVLCCQGMARVDVFVTPDDSVLVNEINTIPGFTRISMYPKLWEASGVPYGDLVDHLIQLAIERFEQEKGLRTSYL